MPAQDLRRAQLQPDIQRGAHVAVARQQAAQRGIAGPMAIAHQRHQLGILVALQPRIGIVLHQRGVRRVEILAGAQVAQKMRGRRAERIMARVQARTSLIDVDPQRLILRAPVGQLLPVAGGQQHAVAVEDVAAGNLAGDGVDARIVLRALHAVVFEYARIARQIFAVVTTW
jgi:hypothetical protein